WPTRPKRGPATATATQRAMANATRRREVHRIQGTPAPARSFWHSRGSCPAISSARGNGRQSWPDRSWQGLQRYSGRTLPARHCPHFNPAIRDRFELSIGEVERGIARAQGGEAQLALIAS